MNYIIKIYKKFVVHNNTYNIALPIGGVVIVQLKILKQVKQDVIIFRKRGGGSNNLLNPGSRLRIIIRIFTHHIK
jgi:hypothetical protein